jgi:dTDP-4-amino-4,6-dideoxygalactose transaminase
VHCGATPVFVDVNETDFNISIDAIENTINSRTKVIMPVDFAGWPCDFDAINQLAVKHQSKFEAANEIQKQLGRILILSDAAHSFGASYNGKKTGSLCDVSVFSFHAVKNLTTAEGGAVPYMVKIKTPLLKPKKETGGMMWWKPDTNAT